MGPPPNAPQEAHGEEPGELFGEARLAASFDRACRAQFTAQAINTQVREDLFRHMAGTSPADDISLLVLTYRGQA